MLCLKLISSGDEPLFKAGGAFLCVCSLKAQRNISNMASAILETKHPQMTICLKVLQTSLNLSDLVEGILARQ